MAKFKQRFTAFLLGLFLVGATGNAMATVAQTPLFLVQSVTPMVMLALSVDHQLFAKAFADFSDLDGDGKIDNTYADAFDYYGYFDSDRCYQYDATDARFEPRDAADGTHGHDCANSASDGDWSGNFLNWATMTRIDVLRKSLYGGKRSTDTASATVLEREFLPEDVHAFVKVFAPDVGSTAGKRAEIEKYTPYSTVTSLSICNVTPDNATYAPRMRLAEGSWPSWASSEVYQCEFYEIASGGTKGMGAAPNNVVPYRADNLYVPGTDNAPAVRVQVCESGSVKETNCKSYDGGTNWKPVGLLQQYGEDGTLRFGLLTGSYQKRDKGGVLRKGIGLIAGNASASNDEVNLTDGTLNASVNGIIGTLNKVRLNSYDYGSHKYSDCNIYGIPVSAYMAETYRFNHNTYNATCSNWGNPLSELYLEAVRYFAGEASATASFTVASDSLSLPTATWSDPLAASEYCAPLNIVLISSGDNSFDTDGITGVPSTVGSVNTLTDTIGSLEGFTAGASVMVGEIGSTPLAAPDNNQCSAKTFTSLSEVRGICPATPTKQGGYQVAGLAYGAHTQDLRTASGYTGDQKINTYAIALAKDLPDFVFTVNGTDITVVPNAYSDFTGVSLPPLNDPGWRAASLAHVFVEDTVNDAGGNLIYARFLAHWEDSAWGNDYDMDVIVRLSVCVGSECTNHDDDGSGSNDTNPGSNVLRVTTRAIHSASGAAMKVGFVVSGTTTDTTDHTTLRKRAGLTYSSFNEDPGRDVNEPTPTVYQFSPGTVAAKRLSPPLEYAAKYGGFTDSNANNQPDVQSEWDEDGDGLPDNYFFADDPSELGPKLAEFLATIATISSSASVVANSVSLQTDTRIYQARFDSADWSGSLLSFPVAVASGALQTTEWDAGDKIALQDYDTGREFVTWDPTANSGLGGGVPFRWASINASQQALLDTSPVSGSADGYGDERLDYLRGDGSLEDDQAGGIFRSRSTPLGDIVHSTPVVVARPSSGYPDSMQGTLASHNRYSDFAASYYDISCLLAEADRDREPMVYFGANDGALHGVSACTGIEKIAYIPNALIGQLPKLTSVNYSHQYYVDGPTTTVDAFFSDNAWHTVLLGSAGAGGPVIFALDVTTASFDESTADALALWEITSASTGFAEMGYAFSQPAVIKTARDGWVVVFGNGYGSASGHAVLYVVSVETGALIRAIDVGGTNNGMATVAPVDSNGDDLVDIIYAGDLNGNLWRFKADAASGFSGTTCTASCNTVSNVSVLYAAKESLGDAQPITTRPEVGVHPVKAYGRMVYFGTGKYFEAGDQDPSGGQENTMYGLWDNDSGATITSVTTRNSTTLQQQTITETSQTFAGTSYDIRVLSNILPSWYSYNTSTGLWEGVRGWYMDLPTTGERMVADPILRGGRLIYVTTIPSLQPCDSGGTSWLMIVDADTGGRHDVPVFDLSGDTAFTLADNYQETSGGVTTYTPISGKKSSVGIQQSPAVLAGIGGDGDGSYGGAEGLYSSGSKEGEVELTVANPLALAAGRKSWVRLQ